MNKRRRRPLRTTLLLCSTAALIVGITSETSADEQRVWRLAATEVPGKADELRNVRLVSPTTFVSARRAIVSPGRIEAIDTTVWSDDWSLTAARVTIDPGVDAVEITTLRTDQE